MLLSTIAEKHPNSFVLLLPKTRDEQNRVRDWQVLNTSRHYDKIQKVARYSQWFEAGVICNKKILASTTLYDKEFFSRRLAVMLIDFMKDDSVRLSKVNSIKNPDLRLILDELPSVADDVKRIYFLVIDVDETIRCERDIVENCVFGGWINKEYVELFDTINALQLFKALIPDILRREMILCG